MTISKSLFITLFVILSSSKNFLTHAQTTFSIKAGVNFSNVALVDEKDEKQNTKSIPGFQIGLTADIPVISDFYIQPGAYYIQKGFKQSGGWLASSGNQFQVKVDYIEVPIHVLYKKDIPFGKIILGAGPYLGYGLGGKWKSEQSIAIGDIMLSEEYDQVVFKDDIKDGEFGTYLYGKPWDYGANFIVGMEVLNKLVLQFHLQQGIRDLTPSVDGAESEGSKRNKGFGISVGYKF